MKLLTRWIRRTREYRDLEGSLHSQAQHYNTLLGQNARLLDLVENQGTALEVLRGRLRELAGDPDGLGLLRARISTRRNPEGINTDYMAIVTIRDSEVRSMFWTQQDLERYVLDALSRALAKCMWHGKGTLPSGGSA